MIEIMAPPTLRSSAVEEFLAGRGCDSAGRRIDDILQFDDMDLEVTHDYIQWLFPLLTRSSAVPESPILTVADIDAIQSDPAAQENLRRSANRMGTFYESSESWLVPHNHNHLRITRIIRSLRLLLSAEEAEEFLDLIMTRVVEAGRPVSPENIRYWRNALGGS